jgi:hypothetical protein
METTKKSSQSRPVLTQTENNTTLWIGHIKSDTNDRIAGQTFTCPSEGMLNNIQVYSSTVQEPGEVKLTLHEFDPSNKQWGPILGSSSLILQRGDDARWIRFETEPLLLKEGATYGFRLQTNNAHIGLGEAAGYAKKPFLFGLAWNSDSNNQLGNFFRYFSMAFKVEVSA